MTLTGPGITTDIKEKIFEPYLTTKEANKGTGMGLAMIHGIVEDEMLAERKTIEQMQTGKERVLFVDDEEILCELGKKRLERLG